MSNLRQLEQSTDLDQIAAFISQPAGSIELPEHLERRSKAYAVIASTLLEYPFYTHDEIKNHVKSVLPDITTGTLYTYIRDTKAIYGRLDKIDRGFERLLIKAQIGKAINLAYKSKDLRAVPKLLDLWCKLYRLDKPDVHVESIEEMQKKFEINFYVQLNEIKMDSGKVIDLDELTKKYEIQQANEADK